MQFLLFILVVLSHVLGSTTPIKDPRQLPQITVTRPYERASSNKTAECARLHGKGLQVCAAVHSSGKTIEGVKCDETLCKASCCKAATICQNASFLSLSTVECISSRLQHDMGSCCVVGKSKGSTMVYAGGAVGAMIICSGLYFIVSMGSNKKVIKGEKPTEEDSDNACKLYETKTPHLQVNQLVATDADDVFWED